MLNKVDFGLKLEKVS